MISDGDFLGAGFAFGNALSLLVVACTNVAVSLGLDESCSSERADTHNEFTKRALY